MNTSNIVHLKRSQIEEASNILAHAFNNDPIFGVILPETDRLKNNILKFFFKRVLIESLPYNYIYTTVDSIKGVAAWLPPEHSNLNMIDLLSSVIFLSFKLGLSKVKLIISILSTLDEQHKINIPQPHWYLNLLGIEPAYQRQGIGSFILQSILQRSDYEGLPCYLETSTEKAVSFYRKHGFEVLKTIEISSNNSQLPIWMMKREPSNKRKTS